MESEVAKLEHLFAIAGYRETADPNLRAQLLEEQGRYEVASVEYESPLRLGVGTPFTYRRLAILYWKGKHRRRCPCAAGFAQ